MKLTKYGHACVFVEKSGSRLVIDPGELTELPEDLSTIIAVIYTHKHGDHVNVDNLKKIYAQNPNVVILSHSEVIDMFTDVDCEKFLIEQEKNITIGPFEVNLKVTDHAIIWRTTPCKNMTVLVDDFYYYPGDSLQVIEQSVEVVGVPLSAPWLKVAEAIEFARSMHAHIAMPTHNGLFNEWGHEFNQHWLKVGLEDTGCELHILQNGESYASKS